MIPIYSTTDKNNEIAGRFQEFENQFQTWKSISVLHPNPLLKLQNLLWLIISVILGACSSRGSVNRHSLLCTTVPTVVHDNLRSTKHFFKMHNTHPLSHYWQ